MLQERVNGQTMPRYGRPQKTNKDDDGCDEAGLGLGLSLGSRLGSRLGLGLGLVLGS